MHVDVGPARRPGSISSIFNEPLCSDDISSNNDGSVELSFDASGMHCDKSRYRYQLKLSREDIAKILQVVRYPATAIMVFFGVADFPATEMALAFNP